MSIGLLKVGTTSSVNLECEASNGKPILCECADSDTDPSGIFTRMLGEASGS